MASKRLNIKVTPPDWLELESAYDTDFLENEIDNYLKKNRPQIVVIILPIE